MSAQPPPTMEKKEKLSNKVRSAVLPTGPQPVAEPEKELRFTRAAQAVLFYVASVMSFATTMAVFILSTQDWGMDGPMLDGWLWLCVPGLILTYLLIRIGLRCTRHAYLILSPLGIEIFPFIKPEKNLQIIYWSEVADAECSPEDKRLVIHFNTEKKSGVVVSLHPIPSAQREFLKKAVSGMMEKKKKASDSD